MKNLRTIAAALCLALIAGCGSTTVSAEGKTAVAISQKANASDCVVGLLSNGSGGSAAVIYETGNWKYRKILDLPHVTPDNYAALSSDGKYLAYTTWDESISRRYLNLYSTKTAETKSFFTDMPAKNEIIKISWMPDNHTLLYIKRDVSLSIYEEIQTLDILTGKTATLVKGEAWQVQTTSENNAPVKDFYLKGAGKALKAKPKGPESGSSKSGTDSNVKWMYYLTQKDIDQIYKDYGGSGSFDIDLIPGYMYVDFSMPRCSGDGAKIIYSTRLTRESAPGIFTNLWIISSIWEYDLKTGKTSIVYTQKDGGAIGHTDWLGSGVVFVSYYEFNGAQDDINDLDLSTGKATVLFSHSDEHYNNVTLVPISNTEISFASTPKNVAYAKSQTLVYNTGTSKSGKLDIEYDGKPVLLENFVFTRMTADWSK